MNTTFKKILLTGSALAALPLLTAALPHSYTLNADTTWASTGTPVQGGTNAASGVNGGNVNLNGHLLTIVNNGTANDGAGLNTFGLGTITGATGGAAITTGSASDLTVYINNLDFTNAVGLSIDTRDADNANIAVNIATDAKVGGAFMLTNHETDQAKTITVNIGRHVGAGSSFMINAGSADGASTTATINGNLTLEAGGFLSGGAGAGANAVLNLKGQQIDFGHGITVVTADKSILNLNGNAAQNVTGKISGDGTVNVANSAGVTFNSQVDMGSGKIVIANGNSSSRATFKNTVDVGSITLGGTASAHNRIFLDTTTQSFSVTGKINGFTNNASNWIEVKGGKTLTQSSAWGDTGFLNTITITGTGTNLLSNAALSARFIEIAGNNTLTASANVSGLVINSGTININGGSITGHITGGGNITVSGSGKITGPITQRTITIDAGQTLEVAGKNGERGSLDATTINLAGAGSTLSLNASDNNVQSSIGRVVAVTPDQGVLNFGTNEAETEIYEAYNEIGADNAKLATVNIGGNNNAVVRVDLIDNLYANSLTIGTNDVLNLLTIGQMVNAAATGTGTINIGATNRNASVILANTTAVGNLNIAQGSTLNAVKDITLSQNLDNDGVMNVITSDGAVTVNATNLFDIDGTVNIRGSNATTAGNATLATGGALNLDGRLATALEKAGGQTALSASTINVGTTNNTTLDLANKTTLSAGAVTLGATGKTVTLNLRPSTNMTNGSTALDVASAINNAGTLIVAVAPNSTQAFKKGDVITVIDSNQNALYDGNARTYTDQIAAGNVKLQGSALIDFISTGSNAQDLIVTVNIKGAGAIFGESNAFYVTDVLLEDFFNLGATPLGTIRAQMLSAPTAGEVAAIANSLTDRGVVTVTAFENGSYTATIIFDQLKNPGGTTGVSSGNPHGQNRAWAQAFGGTAEQGRRGNGDGFNADSQGLVVGFETENLSDKSTIGVALSYGETEVKGKDLNNSRADIESYQITLYGDYDLDNATRLVGMASYTRHAIDTRRHNVGLIAGLTAHGDYNADQFSINTSLDRDYRYNDMTLTPRLLAGWSHLRNDSYTETGAGNASLSIRHDNLNSFDIGAGLEATWEHQTAHGDIVEPSLHATYRYDVIGDKVGATNNFVGGGASFKTQGEDPARHKFNVGASVTLYNTSGWDFTANYDYDFKSDYHGHSGFLRAGMKF